jgi:hypothetical protein
MKVAGRGVGLAGRQWHQGRWPQNRVVWLALVGGVAAESSGSRWPVQLHLKQRPAKLKRPWWHLYAAVTAGTGCGALLPELGWDRLEPQAVNFLSFQICPCIFHTTIIRTSDISGTGSEPGVLPKPPRFTGSFENRLVWPVLSCSVAGTVQCA